MPLFLLPEVCGAGGESYWLVAFEDDEALNVYDADALDCGAGLMKLGISLLASGTGPSEVNCSI